MHPLIWLMNPLFINLNRIILVRGSITCSAVALSCLSLRRILSSSGREGTLNSSTLILWEYFLKSFSLGWKETTLLELVCWFGCDAAPLLICRLWSKDVIQLNQLWNVHFKSYSHHIPNCSILHHSCQNHLNSLLLFRQNGFLLLGPWCESVVYEHPQQQSFPCK